MADEIKEVASDGAAGMTVSPSAITIATGLLPDLAKTVCSFIPDDTAPELCFLTLADVAHRLQTGEKGRTSWYSESQIVEMTGAVSSVIRCINDLGGAINLKDVEEMYSSPSEIFLHLYTEYQLLLRNNEAGQEGIEFITKQLNRIKNYNSQKQIVDVDRILASTHFPVSEMACERDDFRALAQKQYADMILALTHLSVSKMMYKRCDFRVLALAFLWAVKRGHREVVKLILGARSDDHSRRALLRGENPAGDTALIIAARHGHPKIVSLLLQAAPDDAVRLDMLRAEDRSKQTALIETASRGRYPEIVRILLQAAPNDDSLSEMLSITNQHGETAFICAISCEFAAKKLQGHTVIVGMLLQVARNDAALLRMMLTTVNRNGDTALIHAARFGNTEVVKMLLQVAQDDAALLEMMLKAVSRNGETALSLAEYICHAEVVRDLQLAIAQLREAAEESVQGDKPTEHLESARPSRVARNIDFFAPCPAAGPAPTPETSSALAADEDCTADEEQAGGRACPPP